jgi:hypothetical protein
MANTQSGSAAATRATLVSTPSTSPPTAARYPSDAAHPQAGGLVDGSEASAPQGGADTGAVEMLSTDAVVAIRDRVATALRGRKYADGTVEKVKHGRRIVLVPIERSVTVVARGMYVEFSVRSRIRFCGDDFCAQIHLDYAGRAIAPRQPRSFANAFEWSMYDRVEATIAEAL